MSQAKEPLPYRGQDLERLEGLGRSRVRHSYGADDSGRRVYRFNRLGFRGAEYDPAAPYRVFAFGESHAFGYFVDYDDCWPSRFVDLWRHHLGLDRRDVCYLNFADAGASNAAIARGVVSQCSAARPDLVLVHFADLRRSEVILNGLPHRVGHWLLEDEAARAVREAPNEDGLPETLRQLLDRGSSFFHYALGSASKEDFQLPVDATCVLDGLRNLLLVQYFCRSEGIRLVATCEHIEALDSPAVCGDATLGPLMACLDPEVLCGFGIWSVEGDRIGDHAGPRRHDRFAREMFAFYRESAGDTPPAPPPRPREPVDEDPVRLFYQELPFNHFESAAAAAQSLADNPIPEAYPDLHRLLCSGVRRLADCGCGTGWLSSTLARHYEVEVTGIDFTPRALERAREVADQLGVADRARFVEADLMELRQDEQFDLVVSLGALHHTADPRRAFDNVQRLARPGGHVYLGLYHQAGRTVFLEHFRRILDAEGEEAALAEFRRLQPELWDDEHLRSWFRDQVLHPRETRHTLREVVQWLAADGLELVSTSLNRFRRFADLEALYALEAGYEARSRRALKQGRYFPGFFTVLARQRSDPPRE